MATGTAPSDRKNLKIEYRSAEEVRALASKGAGAVAVAGRILSLCQVVTSQDTGADEAEQLQLPL